MTMPPIDELKAMLAKAVAARDLYAAAIPIEHSQHDEAACKECQRARERQWPPSLTCDSGYRDRERVQGIYDRERARRERELFYAARMLIDPMGSLLAAAERGARIEKAAQEMRAFLASVIGKSDPPQCGVETGDCPWQEEHELLARLDAALSAEGSDEG